MFIYMLQLVVTTIFLQPLTLMCNIHKNGKENAGSVPPDAHLRIKDSSHIHHSMAQNAHGAWQEKQNKAKLNKKTCPQWVKNYNKTWKCTNLSVLSFMQHENSHQELGTSKWGNLWILHQTMKDRQLWGSMSV